MKNYVKRICIKNKWKGKEVLSCNRDGSYKKEPIGNFRTEKHKTCHWNFTGLGLTADWAQEKKGSVILKTGW